MKAICLKDKKEFGMIDIFRIICAIGVIAIHLKPMSTFGDEANFFVSNILLRLCVPFFFLTSGFFLYKKVGDWDKLKKYLLNMFRLYVIYTVVNIPMIIKEYEKNEKGIRWCIDTFIRSFFLSGSYCQLWYFVALIVAALLLYFLVTRLKLKDKYIVGISIILYAIGILGSSYSEIIKSYFGNWKISVDYYEIFNTTRNGFFFGFPYIYMGYLINKNKDKIYYNHWYLVIGAIMFGVMATEAYFLRGYLKPWMGLDMTFCLLPTSLSLFLLILFIPLPDKIVEKAKHFRKTSLILFGTHMIVNRYVRMLINMIVGKNIEKFYSYLIVVVVNIALAELIVYLSNKKYFKCLKQLY